MDNIQELIKKIKSKMQTIGKKVEKELPKNCGFVVLATPFNPNGEKTEMMYVSNCNRNDVIKMMIEWIIKTKCNIEEGDNKNENN